MSRRWGTTLGTRAYFEQQHYPDLKARPDYEKLHVLRSLFPNVPIIALSATCPPQVLKDLTKTLQLKPVINHTSTQISLLCPPNT